MGGSVSSTLGRIGSGIGTLGLSEVARKAYPHNSPINQLLSAPGAVFSGGLSAPESMPSVFGGLEKPNPYVSGPFSLDPNQVNADQAQILGLGNKQYQDTLSGLDTYDTAQTKRAKDLFSQMLPDIAENAQAAHLYDSTGYGQEVARQQSDIASQIAADSAEKRLGALGARQGFETGGLQRGLSLEDQINNANISKSIGQAFAPQPATGKQNFGTGAQSFGAIAGGLGKLAK